jgi:MFS family permease
LISNNSSDDPTGVDPVDSAEALRSDEEAFQQQVRRDLPRNFAAHLAHGLLGQTGFRLLNAPTFLPAYIMILSGSEFVVGLCRAIQYLGMFLSPLFGASLIEHRRRVLPVGFLVGSMMRLQVLGIALAGLWLSPRETVVAIAICLFFFGLMMGMQGVIFNFLMSKVIPVERRGVLVGLRTSLAGLTSGAVAYMGGLYLIEPNVMGNGYSVTFMIAFVLTCLGLSMLLFIKEPEPPVVRSQTPLSSRLREIPDLLRSDPEFTVYTLCRSLATMGRMAVPFYILLVGDVIGVANESGRLVPRGETIGILSVAFIMANSVTNVLWGMLADRTGFRLVFIASLALWMGSALWLLQAESLSGFVVAFVGIGAGMGGFQMAAQNMVLEFGSRSDLPVRIALANSAQEFAGFIGPLLGGVLAVLYSKQSVISVSLLFQLGAIALVSRLVIEPRHRESN